MIGIKPISRICTFATVLSVMTGCSSPQSYLLDRKRDAADVFTLCGGVGGGGQIRLGRVPLGAVAEADMVGLRYGEFFRRTEVPEEPEEANTLLANIAALYPAACLGAVDDMYWICEGDFPLNNVQTRRGKGRYPPGSPEWFTAEVVAGIGPMARVGFNAAELLDFVVGWTTIDMLGDDWQGQERRRIQSAASEKARRDGMGPRI